MKIRSKLFLGFGVLILGLVVVVVISLYAIINLKQSVDTSILLEYPKVEAARAIQHDANLISKSTRDLILADSAETFQARIKKIDSLLLDAGEDIAYLEKMVTDAQGTLLLNELRRTGADYMEFQMQISSLVKEGKKEEATQLLIADGDRFQQPMFNALEDLIALNQQKLDLAVQTSDDLYYQIITELIIIPILVVVIGLAIVIWFSRSIVRNIRKVSNVMDQFTQGNLASSVRLTDTSQDELGVVSSSFNRMADTLQEKEKQEEKWNLHNEEQVWLHSNLSSVYEKMQSAQTIEDLTNHILNEIAARLGICCGLLYVSMEDKDGRLSLSGTYAVAAKDKEKLRNVVEAGDGIIGQVAQTGERNVLKEVPADDLRITTELAEIDFVQIYVEPFINENKTEAVLELVLFKELTSIQEQFLQQLSNMGALLLRKIKNKEYIENLLAESQELSEELNVQQEELMQSNAELEEQTASLEESEQRLQTQQGQLEETNSELEEKAEELERQNHNIRLKTKEAEAAKEELERQTQQLIATSAYKSEFLANMSHELRTPLNSMLILTKLLTENKEGNLTKKQVEFAQTVHSSGNDLLTLINEILELAKIESGKMHVNINDIKVDKFVDSIKRNFEPLAQQKGIEMVIDIQPGVPSTFKSDSLRIQQILRNLLSNAFKFTEKGSVTLTIHDVTKEDESILRISVKDTGVGIPEDKKEVIFDAFVQADGTTNRKYGGTGLGLSICRELAGLLDGEIELKSTLGEGSTFTLKLPLNEKIISEENLLRTPALRQIKTVKKVEEVNIESEPDHSELNDFVEISFSGQTVLIVDDDIRNVFAMSSRLEDYDIEVLYANNGKKGIEVLQENPEIDLVLMDIMMPEMDGYTAIRIIRENPQFAKLPIITVTAKAMHEDRNQSVEAGASDFLAKPVDDERLLSLLKIWLVAKK